MVIEQGDVLWIAFPRGLGSEPAGERPVVVLQSDRLNRSGIATTVVAAVTSNVFLARAPGNVLLRKGEANLSRPSVVNVSQLATIDRDRVRSRCGKLTPKRLREVWEGVRLVLEPS